jgi:broad specificity phosphatase PhoE
VNDNVSAEADPDSGSASAALSGVSAAPSASTVPANRSSAALVLIRHGETEWSRSGRHTGRTDVALTTAGEDQARTAGRLIRAVLGGDDASWVISSPRQRALRTAELAGYTPDEITEDASEWDYGDLEGLTSAEIQQQFPDWSIWDGPIPGGEDASAVTARCDRLLKRVSQHSNVGPVLVFSHGHASRCLAARWLGETIAGGRHYWLGTGAVSSLGYEHGRAVILRWNLDESLLIPQ